MDSLIIHNYYALCILYLHRGFITAIYEPWGFFAQLQSVVCELRYITRYARKVGVVALDTGSGHKAVLPLFKGRTAFEVLKACYGVIMLSVLFGAVVNVCHIARAISAQKTGNIPSSCLGRCASQTFIRESESEESRATA